MRVLVKWDLGKELLEDNTYEEARKKVLLPKFVKIPDGMDEEEIGDWLSDKYGYLHYGWVRDPFVVTSDKDREIPMSSENINKLVETVMGKWSEEELVEWTEDQLTWIYEQNPDVFKDAWEVNINKTAGSNTITLPVQITVLAEVTVSANNDIIDELDVEMDTLAAIGESVSLRLSTENLKDRIRKKMGRLEGLEIEYGAEIGNVRCLMGEEPQPDTYRTPTEKEDGIRDTDRPVIINRRPDW